MEKKIRSLLLKMLGTEAYLNLVSSTYIRLIKAGRMKEKYPELFFLEQLVKPGFTCVDIGANVGYYSVFLSRLSGMNGRIYAVEPVPVFARVFMNNAKRFAVNNITLYQCALGAEEKKVKLGTPFIDGVFRHGLTKVMDDTTQELTETYEAEMVIADKLFEPLQKIDFLKCDVEGYEVILFPQMLNTLKRTMPLIQIEITGADHRKTIFDLLLPLGYEVCRLADNNLKEMKREEALGYEGGDFYFRPVK